MGEGRKAVQAWLRMMAVTGDYPIPTSEQSYLAHTDQIDVVLPINGGQLQADGTWLQVAGQLTSDFAQSLPGWATAAGQSYMPVMNPGHGFGLDNLYAVLDDPDLQDDSADDLISLATVGRFDSPWDGVVYDALGVAAGYAADHETFITLLSTRVRAEGLTFVVASPAPKGESTVLPDLEAMADVADRFVYYCYNWRTAPYSTGPFWWVEERIAAALDAGIDQAALYLGIPLFGRYWPVAGDFGASEYVTHAQALELAAADGAVWQWVGADDSGEIDEYRAWLTAGEIWCADWDTLQFRLGLVDDDNLCGVSLFTPGMEDDLTWRALAQWKRCRAKRMRLSTAPGR